MDEYKSVKILFNSVKYIKESREIQTTDDLNQVIDNIVELYQQFDQNSEEHFSFFSSLFKQLCVSMIHSYYPTPDKIDQTNFLNILLDFYQNIENFRYKRMIILFLALLVNKMKNFFGDIINIGFHQLYLDSISNITLSLDGIRLFNDFLYFISSAIENNDVNKQVFINLGFINTLPEAADILLSYDCEEEEIFPEYEEQQEESIKYIFHILSQISSFPESFEAILYISNKVIDSTFNDKIRNIACNLLIKIADKIDIFQSLIEEENIELIVELCFSSMEKPSIDLLNIIIQKQNDYEPIKSIISKIHPSKILRSIEVCFQQKKSSESTSSFLILFGNFLTFLDTYPTDIDLNQILLMWETISSSSFFNMKSSCAFLVLQFWRLSPLEYLISIFNVESVNEIYNIVESNSEELMKPALSILDLIFDRFLKHGGDPSGFGNAIEFLQNVVEMDTILSDEAENMLAKYFSQ